MSTTYDGRKGIGGSFVFLGLVLVLALLLLGPPRALALPAEPHCSLMQGTRELAVDGSGTVTSPLCYGMRDITIRLDTPSAREWAIVSRPTVTSTSGTCSDYLYASYASQTLRLVIRGASAGKDTSAGVENPQDIGFTVKVKVRQAGGTAERELVYEIPVIASLELVLASQVDVPYGENPAVFANGNIDTLCTPFMTLRSGEKAEVSADDLASASFARLFASSCPVTWSGSIPSDYPTASGGGFDLSLLSWGALTAAASGNVGCGDMGATAWRAVAQTEASDPLKVYYEAPEGRRTATQGEDGTYWVQSGAASVGGAAYSVWESPCDLLGSPPFAAHEVQVTADGGPGTHRFYYRPTRGQSYVYESCKTIRLDGTAPVIDAARICALGEEGSVQVGSSLVRRADSGPVDVVDIDVSDDISGLDPSFGRGGVQVTGVDEQGGSWSSDGAGHVRITLPAADARLDLSSITLQARDVAGNLGAVTGIADVLPADNAILMIATDGTAPALAVQWDNEDVRNGHYYASARTAAVVVLEANFDLLCATGPDLPIATKTRGASVETLHARDFHQAADGTWQASLPFGDDGDYVLEAGFADVVGRQSNTCREAFTVDMTAPVLAVSWDNMEAGYGSYYKAPRTATIRVAEHNFADGLADVTATAASGNIPLQTGWGAEGDVHVATVFFGDETTYTLSAGVTDLAGNVAEPYDSGPFTLDMTMPVVEISQVEDLQAYAGTVAPQVSCTDINLATPCLVELSDASTGESVWRNSTVADGGTVYERSYEDFGHVVGNDGVYRLHVTAADKAGNEQAAEVVFSVNRFGSTYLFGTGTGEALGSYLPYSPEVAVTEINPSGIAPSDISLFLTHDSTTRVLENGKDFSFEAVADAKWPAYVYELPREAFAADGYYRLVLKSYDAAGNLNENIMKTRGVDHETAAEVAFAVDKTAPQISFMGACAETAVYAPSFEVGACAVDNLGLASVYASIDGGAPTVWDERYLAEHRTVSFDVPSSKSPQTLVLVATDKAGNTGTATLDKVLVTNDPLIFWLNTPRLLYASIVGLFALAAAVGMVVAWCAVRSRRKVRASF